MGIARLWLSHQPLKQKKNPPFIKLIGANGLKVQQYTEKNICLHISTFVFNIPYLSKLKFFGFESLFRSANILLKPIYSFKRSPNHLSKIFC